MNTKLPLTIVGSPLPFDFSGTPEQQFEAMLARMSISTSLENIVLLASGNVEPSSNVGPWLKNGTTLYVWSSTTGGYVPANIEFPSLRYIAQADAPDPDVYVFWIQLNASGVALTINYYSGGWKPIAALPQFGTPSSAIDTGLKGMVKFDTSFIYACVADNTWKRVAIATW